MNGNVFHNNFTKFMQLVFEHPGDKIGSLFKFIVILHTKRVS